MGGRVLLERWLKERGEKEREIVERLRNNDSEVEK